MTGDGTSERGSRPPRTLFSLGREGSKRRRGGTDVAEVDEGRAEPDESPARCADCGEELVGGAGFCGSCGAAVAGGAAAGAAAAATELIDEDLELDELEPADLIDEELALDDLSALDEADAQDAIAEEAVVETPESVEDAGLVEEAALVAGAVAVEALADAPAEAVDVVAETEAADTDVADTDATEADELEVAEATDTDEIEADEQTETGLAVLAAARAEGPKPREPKPAREPKTDSDTRAPVGWIIGGIAAAILLVVGIVVLATSGGGDSSDVASTPSSTAGARESTTSTTASTTTTQPTTTTTAETTTTTAAPTTQAPPTTVISGGPIEGPKTPAALRVAGITCPLGSNPCTIAPGGTLTVTIVNDGGSAGSYSLSGPGLQGPNGALSGESSVSVTVRDTIEESDRLATLTITGAGGLSQTVNVLVQ